MFVTFAILQDTNKLVLLIEKYCGQSKCFLLFQLMNTVIKSLVFFLFSCRYNPLWLYFHSPVAGFSLLVFEVS
jgi:hypothetical protein